MFMQRHSGTVSGYFAVIGTQAVQGLVGFVEEYEERGGN